MSVILKKGDILLDNWSAEKKICSSSRSTGIHDFATSIPLEMSPDIACSLFIFIA